MAKKKEVLEPIGGSSKLGKLEVEPDELSGADLSGQVAEVDADPAPRGPRQHVVAPGDTQREPTETEVLARQPVPTAAELSEPSLLDRIKRRQAAISFLRSSRVKWQALSPFQRYFLTGVEVLAKELLGENHEGKPASVDATLGITLSSPK